MGLGFRDREGGSVVGDGLGDGGGEELPRRDGAALLLGDGGHDGDDVVLPGRPVSAPGVQLAGSGDEAGLTGRVEVDSAGQIDEQIAVVTGVALWPVIGDGVDRDRDHSRKVVRDRVRANNSSLF